MKAEDYKEGKEKVENRSNTNQQIIAVEKATDLIKSKLKNEQNAKDGYTAGKTTAIVTTVAGASVGVALDLKLISLGATVGTTIAPGVGTVAGAALGAVIGVLGGVLVYQSVVHSCEIKEFFIWSIEQICRNLGLTELAESIKEACVGEEVKLILKYVENEFCQYTDQIIRKYRNVDSKETLELRKKCLDILIKGEVSFDGIHTQSADQRNIRSSASEFANRRAKFLRENKLEYFADCALTKEEIDKVNVFLSHNPDWVDALKVLINVALKYAQHELESPGYSQQTNFTYKPDSYVSTNMDRAAILYQLNRDKPHTTVSHTDRLTNGPSSTGFCTIY